MSLLQLQQLHNKVNVTIEKKNKNKNKAHL